MNIALPRVNIYPTTYDPTNDELLSGSRISTFTFEILDNKENYLGLLYGVQTGGASLSWSASASVKGSGKFNVLDTHLDDVDWMHVRIRPRVSIRASSSNRDPIKSPLGVWIPAAPKESWTKLGRTWAVSLTDKCGLLDECYADPVTGIAKSFGVSAGANVIETVKSLITGIGESVPAITTGTETVQSDRVWDIGTTRLKIINDLLDAANYFSLWCDESGQYRCTKYQDPASRSPSYSTMIPFSDLSPTGAMSPDWTKDNDVYNIPNRYVVVSQGTGSAAGLTSTALNNDPNSRYSRVNRGRWITKVETGVQVENQAALDSYAKRALVSATGVSATLAISHLLLPALKVNQTVRFQNEGSGDDVLASVTNTTFNLDPLAFSTSSLETVTEVTT